MYTPTTWKDRAVQYAKRYFLRDNGGSDKNLLPPFNEGWTLHENTRMKQGNYVGKVSGSTVENPHLFKTITMTTLLAPSSITNEFATSGYTNTSTLNAVVQTTTRSLNSEIAAHLHTFDLIEHVLRNYGASVFGVAVTTAERVAWLKANVSKLNVNWHGYGSGPSGNKAKLAWWTGVWTTSTGANWEHTAGTVTKISPLNVNGSTAWFSDSIDASGFAHILAYCPYASDGVTASTINTDFVELEVYMAAGSIPQADYTLSLNATATNQNSSFLVPVNASTQYTMSITLNANSKVRIDAHDSTQTFISMVRDYSTSFPYTFTTPANTYYLMLYFSNVSAGAGAYTFTNPQLELGSSATSFAPMKTYDVTQAPGIVTQAGTPLNAANLNTIETGLAAAHAAGFANDTLIGNRTITDSTAQTGGAAATLTTLIGQIGNMIKAITGKSNWYTSPVTSIESLNTLKAPLASPGLTGTPTAPTASAGTNTTQIATTEFVTSANSQVLISNTVLASDTATVSFSSIPGTYKDLIVVIHGVSTTTGADTVGVQVTINDDAYNYYRGSRAYWDGSGSLTGGGGIATYYYATPVFAGKLSSSDSRGYVEMTIPNYAATTGYKTMYSKFSAAIGTGVYHGQSAAHTTNLSNAITKITIYMATGAFATGTQMALYGRR